MSVLASLSPRPSCGVLASALSRCVWAFVCALVLTWSAPSRADDEQARARTLFAQGVEGFERGDYEAALAAFEQAYRLAPHPAVRVNMANCFEQLGRFPEAVFNYERFLQESDGSATREQRAAVSEAIQRLKQRIGHLVVVTSPADAALTIDGAAVVHGELHPIPLAAGTHTLRAVKPGYVPSERLIEVQAGVERRIRLELMSETPVVAQPLNTDVASEPTSYDDDPPPAFATRARAGSEGERRRLRPAVWVALGTTALFGAGAAVSGVLALRAERDFEDALARSKDARLDEQTRAEARAAGYDASDRANVFATVTDVLIGATAVSATTAAVLWWVDRRRASGDRQRLSFRTTVGPRGTALGVLGGRF